MAARTFLKDTSASALRSPRETICLMSGRPAVRAAFTGEGLRVCTGTAVRLYFFIDF